MGYLILPLQSCFDNLNWLIEIFFWLLVLMSVKLYLKNKQAHKWVKQFDGPPPDTPFLGNTKVFFSRPTETHKALHDAMVRFGSICRLWVVRTPLIATTDVELIKKVLLSSNNLNKLSFYRDLLEPAIGNLGLITSEAHQWRLDRKLFNKAFSSLTVKSYFENANTTSKEIINALNTRDGTPINSYAFFIEYALAVTLKTLAHGARITKAQIDKVHEVLDGTEEVIRARGFKPWLQNPILWWLSGYEKKEIKERARLIIRSIGESVAEQEPDSLHVLSELLFTEKHDAEWRYQHAKHIFGAASETSAFAITVTLFHLSLNPKILEKVRNEVDAAFAESPSKTLEFSSLSKLKYLKMCIKESLRIHGPVAFIGRTLGEDITLADGRKIPNGTGILILLAELSRRPDLFPNPFKFDPERFNDENMKKMNPFSYIPFSAGPRDCVGKRGGEMKTLIIVANILRHFNISTDQKPEDLEQVCLAVTTFVPPILLSFQKR